MSSGRRKGNTGPKRCKRCDVPVRHVQVFVGPPPGEPVTLCIDENPHPEGRVVQLRDGRWRLLALHQEAAKDSYRIHGVRSCGAHAVGAYGRRL